MNDNYELTIENLRDLINSLSDECKENPKLSLKIISQRLLRINKDLKKLVSITEENKNLRE